MEWYALADNPRAVSELYSQVPPLKAVRLREALLDQNDLFMIKVDLPAFPDRIPPRWKFQGYNAVQLQ